MDRTKFLMEHFGLTKRPNPTYKQYFTFGELQKLLINYEKAINYSRCCESDSDKLPSFLSKRNNRVCVNVVEDADVTEHWNDFLKTR